MDDYLNSYPVLFERQSSEEGAMDYIAQLFMQDHYENNTIALRTITASGMKVECSYAELQKNVEKLSIWFSHEAKLLEGERVALYAHNSIAYVICVLAAWHAGLVVVPIDPACPIETVLRLLKETAPRIVLSDVVLAHRLQEIILDTIVSDVIFIDKIDCFLSGKYWSPWRVVGSFHHFILLQNIVMRSLHLKTLIKSTFWADVAPKTKINGIALLCFQWGNSPLDALGAIVNHRHLIAYMSQAEYTARHFSVGDFQDVLCAVHLTSLHGLLSVVSGLLKEKTISIVTPQQLIQSPKLLNVFAAEKCVAHCSVYEELLQRYVSFTFPASYCFFESSQFISEAALTEWNRKMRHPVFSGLHSRETVHFFTYGPQQHTLQQNLGHLLCGLQITTVDQVHFSVLGFDQMGKVLLRGTHVIDQYWQHTAQSLELKTLDGWLKAHAVAAVSERGRVYQKL